MTRNNFEPFELEMVVNKITRYIVLDDLGLDEEIEAGWGAFEESNDNWETKNENQPSELAQLLKDVESSLRIALDSYIYDEAIAKPDVKIQALRIVESVC